MPEFMPAMPHGSFREEFPDVFVMTGGFRMGPGMSIPRNMTVVRRGGELTIINSVRLTPAGERALEELGTPKHLLRIGLGHGADDPYYLHRYRPSFWAPEGMKHSGGIAADEVLRPGHSPIAESEVFVFENGRGKEAAVRLDHEGGVLVTCDSYQNWESYEGCSPVAKVVAKVMGFGPTYIGGPWLKRMGPGVRKDFERLREVRFDSLIAGHGQVLRKKAREGLDLAMGRRFGR